MDAENNGLFRPQAIEYATGKLYGDVLVRPKPSHLILTGTCVLWLLALVYLAYAFEWTREETIHGIVEIDSSSSRLVGTFYLPVHARQYIDTDQIFTVSVEGAPQSYSLPVRIERISDRPIANCPVCTGEKSTEQPYLQFVASLQGEIVPNDGRLTLGPGFRLSFVLPTEKRNARNWVAGR